MQPARTRTDQISSTVIKATRSVLILRLLGSVLAGIVAIVGWQLGIWAIPTLLGICSIVGIAAVGQSAIGAIHASPTGIKFRTGTRTEAIRWAGIHQFVEIARPWGMRLAVDKSVPEAMPVRYLMPAPKTSLLFVDPAYERDVARLRAWAGMHNAPATAPTRLGFGSRRSARIGCLVLLLAVAPVDRPLGWVSGPQASAVPVACAALSDALATEVGAHEPDAGSQSRTTSVCTWKIPAGTLTIAYHLFEREGLHSGSDRAAEDQSFQRTDRYNNGFTIPDSYRPQAQQKITAPGWSFANATILAMLSRSANVEITVEMNYTSVDDATLAALSSATNTAIAAVRTG